jgi:dTMP kinase
LDGIDKAGKGTQAERLHAALAGSKVFSFPRYETPLGQAIKRHLAGRIAVRVEHSIDSSDIRIDGDTVYRVAPEDALVFQCMMTADKYAAAPEIRTRQESGLVTICDRYWPSGYAYGVADGLDQAWLREVHRALPQPDVCALIDLPVEVALARGREGRPDVDDRYERDRAKLARVRDVYLELWAENPRWVVIDGALPAAAIHEQLVLGVTGDGGVSSLR